MQAEEREKSERPWWETDPVAQRLIARGATPPSRDPRTLVIPEPIALEGEGPAASEMLLEDRRRGL